MRQVPTNGDPGTEVRVFAAHFHPFSLEISFFLPPTSSLVVFLIIILFILSLLSELVLLVLFRRGKRREFAELLHSLMPIKLARKRHKSFKNSHRFLKSPLRDAPDEKICEVV